MKINRGCREGQIKVEKIFLIRKKKKSGRPSKGGQPKQNQGVRNEMEGGEGDFEEKVLTIIKEGNWEELEMAAVD